MARKDDSTEAPPVEMPAAETATIEDHCKDLPRWKYAGFRARYGYGLGKLLTKAVFETQMTAWVNGPVDA